MRYLTDTLLQMGFLLSPKCYMNWTVRFAPASKHCFLSLRQATNILLVSRTWKKWQTSWPHKTLAAGFRFICCGFRLPAKSFQSSYIVGPANVHASWTFPSWPDWPNSSATKLVFTARHQCESHFLCNTTVLSPTGKMRCTKKDSATVGYLVRLLTFARTHKPKISDLQCWQKWFLASHVLIL